MQVVPQTIVSRPKEPRAGVTTRYYYAGVSMIEERDGSDALVRFHVNEAPYSRPM